MMPMKMTRLEWRYLQKIALDHPYFDTHELPLTEKEAEAIVKANIHLTGREFVDSIYAKLGMARPKEEKKPFAWLHSIGEQFTIPPLRKIVISVLVILLLTMFFAATPMGQAIAESVIQYIATLFEDGSLAITDIDYISTLLPIKSEAGINESDHLDEFSNNVYIDSFDDFINVTGKNPVVLPLPCTKLYYEHDESVNYLKLQAVYKTSNGMIYASQIWVIEDLISTTLTGFTKYNGNETIYYSIEEGKIIINIVLEDSVFGISAKGNYSLDELVKTLKDEIKRVGRSL